MRSSAFVFPLFLLTLAGISSAPAAERTDKILIGGNPAGSQTVKEEPAGVFQAEYSFTDRGRRVRAPRARLAGDWMTTQPVTPPVDHRLAPLRR